MFQKGDYMVVLAALIIFAVVGGIFVNYLRKNQNDIGGGLGKDYMKEHWGIDEDIMLTRLERMQRKYRSIFKIN